MTPWPSYHCDLDAQTRDALRDNNLSAFTEGNVNDEYNSIFLLATVCINNRLDLAEQLLSAGAIMTADQFNEVLNWNSQTDTITYLLNQRVPHNESSLGIVHSGNWDIVFSLLEHGANIQAGTQFWFHSKHNADIVTDVPLKDSGYVIGRTSWLHTAV